jgi:hypothetical protein
MTVPHLITLVLLTGAVASAQIARPVGPLPPATTAADGAAGRALIKGTAVDANAKPLPGAAVRLRNLETNQIEHVTTSNTTGEFTFVVIPEVPYVVEIADSAGRILGVGDVIVAQAGDVAAAVVEIPARLPAMAGMFSDTAGSVVSAATGTGITAFQLAVLPFLTPEK